MAAGVPPEALIAKRETRRKNRNRTEKHRIAEYTEYSTEYKWQTSKDEETRGRNSEREKNLNLWRREVRRQT